MLSDRPVWLGLLLLACSPIRVYTEDPEALPLLEEAGDVLGTPIRVVDAPGPGVTTLEIRGTELDPETGQQICGRALERVLHADSVYDALTGGVVECSPRAWSCATVTFVAHELGHLYGLPHVEQTEDRTTKGNTMQPAPGNGRHLTDGQKLVVRLHAEGLHQICRRVEPR